MKITFKADRHCIADVIDDLDARTHLVQTETIASENPTITLCMQVCKAVAELERLIVDNDLTECTLATLGYRFRQCFFIDTQKVTNSRFVKADESSHAVVRGYMHYVFLYVAETACHKNGYRCWSRCRRFCFQNPSSWCNTNSHEM